MTFFKFVRIPRLEEVFSEIAQVSLYLPWPPRCWQSLNKFYDSVIEIFGNEVLGVINTVKKHTTEING